MKVSNNDLLLLLLFLIIIKFYYKKNLIKNKFEKFNNKPIIWMYWENLPGKKKPGYIDLCIDSIKHNCSNCFNIVICNENTITNYIPDINNIDLSGLKIPIKADYYRYCLLHKYGGIWLDADTIVLKCLCPIYKKLEEYDYIGFGCGYKIKDCGMMKIGYGKPFNGIMMSKPNTKFITCVKNKAIYNIKNDKMNYYHSIGRYILEKCIKECKINNPSWDYYHFPSECQEYDSFGNKLYNILSENINVLDCDNKRYFFPLYNTHPGGFKDGYPLWFKNMSKEELLNAKIPISPIFTKAFEYKKLCY
jgi:hypothetical protein